MWGLYAMELGVLESASADAKGEGNFVLRTRGVSTTWPEPKILVIGRFQYAGRSCKIIAVLVSSLF